MSGWSLVFDAYDPPSEKLREALCVLGNGYFATRGAGAESDADEVHYPATYVAGCYNRLGSQVGDRVIENEDFVNVPNWLSLGFRIGDGPWFGLDQVEVLSYRQELDMRRGLLLRHLRVRDGDGRVTAISDERFVHMGRPHLAAHKRRIVAENWAGPLTIRSALDGRVINGGVARYSSLNQRHLAPLATGSDGDTIWLKAETVQSEVRIAEAARTQLFRNGREETPPRETTEELDRVAQDITLALGEGDEVVVEKVVALHTSRDAAISECGLAARNSLVSAGSYDELLREQEEAWGYLWDQCDVDIEPDSATEAGSVQTILRLHIFHLLQTTSPNSRDLDVGIPPRGLHGEAYRGHIFWDEVFIFPFLNLRMPEITRGLLLYRYRRLDEARAAARANGLAGAMYPWQSGSDGREESQQVHLNPVSGRWIPDNSSLQRHVNAAIAYNTWQYYQATDDFDFLWSYGAEMLLELARFWASLATYNEELGRYEILGVMGPDEYHDGYPDRDEPGLDNNGYSNVMAVWVICRAMDVLDILPAGDRKRLVEKLKLSEEETVRWDDISRKMRLVFHGDGILSQFEGWDKLEELDWEGLRARHGDIRRLDRVLEAEGDTPNRYKASKQADVLMLYYLFSGEELRGLYERLGYPFDEATVERTIEHYIARTSNGSSLSEVVNASLQARSDPAASWRLFCDALQTDVGDKPSGTTREGIHLGAMVGSVDIVLRGYAGIELRGDALYIDPRLPEAIDRIRLQVRFRGHALRLDLQRERLNVAVERCAGDVVKVSVRGQPHELTASEIKEFPN